MAHELVHAWIFLHRAKSGNYQLMRSGGHDIDSLEEAVCNLAAFEYTQRTAAELAKIIRSEQCSAMGKARHNEKIKIAVFLLAKLKRNSGNQELFEKAMQIYRRGGWNAMLHSVADTGYY
jgi:hypothetical protein